jgi:hypothetical protein
MKLCYVFIFVSFIISCRDNSNHKKKETFTNLLVDSLLVQGLSNKALALNIPQINKGVDSFELRIWHGMTIAQPKHLITLKYQNSKWHLFETNYWIRYEWENGSPQDVIFDSSFVQSLPIPFNISSLVDSIFHFGLDSFPSQHEIPEFRDRVADGMFYAIEIATPQYYKALAFSNPERYTDAYNRRITQLLISLKKIGVFTPF